MGSGFPQLHFLFFSQEYLTHARCLAITAECGHLCGNTKIISLLKIKKIVTELHLFKIIGEKNIFGESITAKSDSVNIRII